MTKKLEVSNAFLLIYLLYIVFVWLNEALNLSCFLIGYEQSTLVSQLAVVIGIIMLWRGVKNRIVIVKKKRSFITYIFLLLIAVFGIIKSCYPDVAYDTGNYHILSQHREFINWFEKGYGAGNFQVWGFRLGDRLFTLFRHILGYRYGTLLNTLVIMLAYIQITDLLFEYLDLLKYEKKGIRFIAPSILGIATIFVHDVVMEVGTYYVDILSVPLSVELIKKVCIEEQQERNVFEHGYVALLLGIIFTLKLTNIIYILPLLVIYICLNFRKIKKVSEWCICILLGLIPCSIYMIFNFVCTGNPVFPYFNSLFKSKYFLQSNFIDVRWGGSGFFEKLLWIFYHIFKPDYRQSEIPNKYICILAVALISTIFMFLFCVKRIIVKRKEYSRRESIFVKLFIFIFGSAFLWSFTTGYSRYFLLGDMMLIYLLSLLVLEGIKFIKSRWLRGIAVVGLCFSLCVPVLEVRDNLNGREWGWRKVDVVSLRKQLQYVFKDQTDENVSLMVDSFILTEPLFCEYAYLVKPNAEIFNAYYLKYMEKEEKLSYVEKLENVVEENENVYDIRMAGFADWENYMTTISDLGFSISETININSSVYQLTLIKLKNASG